MSGLARLDHCGLDFQLFGRQLQLLDLPVELFGRMPELHPPEPRDLHAS
jgi:hypothetical protein